MSALPLFDYAMTSAPSGDDPRHSSTAGRLTPFAESLVRSVLDEVQRVELFERTVAEQGDDVFQFDRDVAVLVRFSYEECVKHAEQVLQRVARLESRGATVRGTQELRDAHGRLATMLSVSLEDVAAAQAQADAGNVHSATELRDELHARIHG